MNNIYDNNNNISKTVNLINDHWLNREEAI